MARSVSKKAWERYTGRLEAQRNAAWQDAYDWALKHAENGDVSLRRLRVVMVETANYHGKSTSALAATS